MSSIEVSSTVERFQNGDAELIEELVNGNDLQEQINGDDSQQNAVRVIRKAKRFHRQNSGSDSQVSNGDSKGLTQAKQALAIRKNSRKSRDGRGRGLPKKGGAGGKGTWGALGDELIGDSKSLDSHDPNYDSESEDDYVVEKIDLEISPEELKKVVEPVIFEYFDHGDTEEVQDNLEELNLRKMKPKLIELLVNIALDHKAAHREMTSRLLSDLYGNVLSTRDIAQGFDDLLKSLNDLSIDAPEAPRVVGQFIARAVADDCLPPKFVASYKGKVDNEHSVSALERAQTLLEKDHGIVRLDNIWGAGGGIRPVKYLTKRMVGLLKEYLSSGDISEATRCLRELEVPHFHHELVYEAAVMVLEDGTERSAERMCSFLKSLGDTVVISPEQMNEGFKRVYDALPDITLDVPAAYTLLERFATMCHKVHVLGSDIYQELPQRGRKRFVSEGDGGRIKEQTL